MPPEQDYDAATAREFERERARGTRQALIRFIARHPRHPLAGEARALLDTRRDWPGQVDPGDPDAAVYAGFDRARQADRAEEYDAFIARFAPHPLADEAARLRDRPGARR